MSSKSAMNNEILHNSETMRVEYFYTPEANNKKLVFLFTVYTNRSLEGITSAGPLFFRNGYDLIAFKVSNDDWYQSTPLSLFEKINNITNVKNYENKIAYGSSMGGYASIAFSSFLKCNSVIAMSPQFSIDESFDTNWESSAKKINFQYRICEKSIKDDCKFFIFYDNYNKDALHAEKIFKLIPAQNLSSIKVSYAGHPVTTCLFEADILKDLVIKIADGNSFEENSFIKDKGASKTYLRNLSVHLLKKKHARWSLKTIEAAIKIDGKLAEFHRHKSVVLDRLGRSQDAIAAIKEAIALDSNNPHYLGHLTSLLNKQGQP